MGTRSVSSCFSLKHTLSTKRQTPAADVLDRDPLGMYSEFRNGFCMYKCHSAGVSKKLKGGLCPWSSIVTSWQSCNITPPPPAHKHINTMLFSEAETTAVEPAAFIRVGCGIFETPLLSDTQVGGFVFIFVSVNMVLRVF